MRKNLFQTNSFRNKYQTLINQINERENHLKSLSDNELRAQSFQLKKQYQETQDLNSLIAPSFALTREASLRTLGLRHFDVQLIGGLVLNNQKIAEMKTGEGKTLVATLPAGFGARYYSSCNDNHPLSQLHPQLVTLLLVDDEEC